MEYNYFKILRYMKKIIFLYFILISSLLYSQKFEKPDNWFIGLNYSESLSNKSLQQDNEDYTYDLEIMLRRFYDNETSDREAWLLSGGLKNLEPKEKVLLFDDFYSKSAKYMRMSEISQNNILEENKLMLQWVLIYDYKFDKREIQFDKKGDLKSIILFKNIDDMNSAQTKHDFAIMKDTLNEIYGLCRKTGTDDENSPLYIWDDSHADVGLEADVETKTITLIYFVN